MTQDFLQTPINIIRVNIYNWHLEHKKRRVIAVIFCFFAYPLLLNRLSLFVLVKSCYADKRVVLLNRKAGVQLPLN
jgi:hypothetical protein